MNRRNFLSKCFGGVVFMPLLVLLPRKNKPNLKINREPKLKKEVWYYLSSDTASDWLIDETVDIMSKDGWKYSGKEFLFYDDNGKPDCLGLRFYQRV